MTSREFVLALETLGWSQAEASRQLGVTESAVSRWVSGDRPIPGPISILMGEWGKLHARAGVTEPSHSATG